MYWKDVAYLMKEKITLDELHRPKIEYSETKAFCNIKSIGQSDLWNVSRETFCFDRQILVVLPVFC